ARGGEPVGGSVRGGVGGAAGGGAGGGYPLPAPQHVARIGLRGKRGVRGRGLVRRTLMDGTSLPHAPPRAPADAVPRAAPIRLLLVTDTAILGRGGSERFISNLLAGLDPHRFRVDVLQLTEPLPPAECLRAPPAGNHVRLEHLPVGAVYGKRGRMAYRALRERVAAGGYDIVQSQHEKSDLLCALLPRRPGGPWRISNRRDMGFQKSRLLRAAFRLLNRRFDRVVAPSRAILDALVASDGVHMERT